MPGAHMVGLCGEPQARRYVSGYIRRAVLHCLLHAGFVGEVAQRRPFCDKDASIFVDASMPCLQQATLVGWEVFMLRPGRVKLQVHPHSRMPIPDSLSGSLTCVCSGALQSGEHGSP